MSFEAVRAAVAAQVNTGWTAAALPYKLEFENINKIDHTQETAPFVTFQLKWRDARQASIENNPTKRREGEAVFHIHVPGGDGTKPMTTIADALTPILEFQKISNVQFLVARLLPSGEYLGWQITPLAVSFWYRE